MDIGKRIKELRLLNNLTQEELADRCELTKGHISLIENNRAEPTLATLEDIINALGTNLSDFFAKQNKEKIVWSKNEYIEKIYDKHTIEWLVPNAQKNEMEPILVTLDPHSKTEIDYPHEGQEFGYVLEGELLLCIDNAKLRVKKGETFYFDSIKNHFIMNVKDKVCRLIWVSSPPNF